MTIHARLLCLVGVFFLSVGSAFGDGTPLSSPASPSKDLVIQLLTLREERFKKDYEIVLIMPGETKFQGVTVANAAHVTFFGPVVEEGRKKRVLSTDTLLWNEEYGWFFCEVGERLSRTTVFIWSERKGIVQID